MKNQSRLDYDKIQQAIEFLNEHFKSQPKLEQVAEHVHLSPFHFQKLFTEWAGVSPKKYLQFLGVNYAKNTLRRSQQSLLNTAMETGISSTSRLHDLFVNIEGMTPGEYKNAGQGLDIQYSFSITTFGLVIVASTAKGICWLTFCSSRSAGLAELQGSYPNARYNEVDNSMHQRALAIFNGTQEGDEAIKLHLKGTDFQLKVWQALLNIPLGDLACYGDIADKIGSPKASRAVGTAIGNNPVAYIIPCHRVIQASGNIGAYHWGASRKQSMIAWEAAQATDAG